MNESSKVRILVLFLGKSKVDGWPQHHHCVSDHIAVVKKKLEGLKLKEYEFFGFKQIETLKDIWDSYELMSKADGQIIVGSTAEFAVLGPDLGKLLETELPSIIYTLPFSVYYDGYACVKNSGGKVCVVASSNEKDLLDSLYAIRTIKKLRDTRLLVVRDLVVDYSKIEKAMLDPVRWKGPAYCKKIKSTFGVEIVFATSDEVMKYYNSKKLIDEEAIQKDLSKYKKEQFKEPTQKDVYKAIRMYYAIKLLMKEKGCTGMTVDCLTFIREEKMPISPCYAISRLLAEGSVSGCEADVESVICLGINQFLTNTPGFQGDPVIDRGAKQVIVAHCTASPRMMNETPDIEDCNFWFRTHNESHRDCGIEVKMPENKPVTVFKLMKTGTIKYVGLPMVFTSVKDEQYHLVSHETTSVHPHVEDSEWGCRTKVGLDFSKNMKELEEFEENFFGHHRIVVYGHHQRKLKILCKLLGVKFHDKMYLKSEK